MPLHSILDQTLIDLELIVGASWVIIEAESVSTVVGKATRLGQLFYKLISDTVKSDASITPEYRQLLGNAICPKKNANSSEASVFLLCRIRLKS